MKEVFTRIRRQIKRRIDVLVELRQAISVAHTEGEKPLDVKSHGSFYSWSPESDSGYICYKKARRIISGWPRIELLLRWFKYI